MSFLFGFMLPVERLPLLVTGPAITAAGLAFGVLELQSRGPGLSWCVFDLILGVALTACGIIDRRKRAVPRGEEDAGGPDAEA